MPKCLPIGLLGHLARQVRKLRRRHRKRWDRCRRRTSECAVHELRIETRRALALLDLLDAVHAAASNDKLRRAFKKRLDDFDDLRDTQVHLKLLKPLWKDLPEAREFRSALRHTEKQQMKQLAKRIRQSHALRLNRKLKRIETTLEQCPPCAVEADRFRAASALQAAFDGFADLRKNVRRSRPATIHRMRIAFKRVRYMSELLEPFAPWISPGLLKRMKQYQDMAGAIQDFEVLRGRVQSAAARGDVKRESIRRLKREIQKQQRRAMDAFMNRIDEAFDFRPPPTAATGNSTESH